MKKVALISSFLFIFAVLPTTIVFMLLITSSPLQGIGHEYFYARGSLVEPKQGKHLMRFEESSTFWDTSVKLKVSSKSLKKAQKVLMSK